MFLYLRISVWIIVFVFIFAHFWYTKIYLSKKWHLNIFVVIFTKKFNQIYLYLYLPKNVNPNIFVFVFAKKYRPEYICNCIQVWELYLSHTGSLERVIVEQKMIFNKLKFFWMDFYLEKFSLNKYFHTIIVYNGICKL